MKARRRGVGATLMQAAVRARRDAYANESGFTVGAALLTTSGRIFHGCNVENTSYGLTMCAERVAVFNAVSAGERDFKAIAITCKRGASAAPCGACRQVLHEFAPKLTVHYTAPSGRVVTRRLDQLLPEAFELKRKRK